MWVRAALRAAGRNPRNRYEQGALSRPLICLFDCGQHTAVGLEPLTADADLRQHNSVAGGRIYENDNIWWTIRAMPARRDKLRRNRFRMRTVAETTVLVMAWGYDVRHMGEDRRGKQEVEVISGPTTALESLDEIQAAGLASRNTVTMGLRGTNNTSGRTLESIKNCCPVNREISEHRRHCYQEAPRSVCCLHTPGGGRLQVIARCASSLDRAMRLALPFLLSDM